MTALEAADVFRSVAVVLFTLAVAQTVAVVVYYHRVRRRLAAHRNGGLLPLHVILVSLALLWFMLEAVVTNYQRITQPPTFWLGYNIVLLAVTDWALWLVLHYERRRFQRLP